MTKGHTVTGHTVTGHKAIPTCDQGIDHYEETTPLKLEVDVEMGEGYDMTKSSDITKSSDKDKHSDKDKPFDVNDDPCIKRLNVLNNIVIGIFFIVSFIALVKLFTGYNFYNDMYKVYYDDTTMLNVSLPDTTTIEGSLATIDEPPSAHCEDYAYGCCEIYDTCSVSSGEFDATSLSIDPRIVHKHDAAGTNCPRVNDMIGKYMDNYGKTSCASSEYGCCELNFICDMREYYRIRDNEGKHYAARAYQSNVMHGYISESMGIAKLNEQGSNCPQHYNLIIEYESGNLNKKTKANKVYMFVAIIMGVLSLVLICHACSVRNGNK